MTSSTTLPAHLDVYILSLTRIGLDDSTLNSVIANVPRSGVLWSRRAVAHRQQARHRRADPGGQRFDRHRIADHAQRAAQRTRRVGYAPSPLRRTTTTRSTVWAGPTSSLSTPVPVRALDLPVHPSDTRITPLRYTLPPLQTDRHLATALATALAHHCIPNHPTHAHTESALRVRAKVSLYVQSHHDYPATHLLLHYRSNRLLPSTPLPGTRDWRLATAAPVERLRRRRRRRGLAPRTSPPPSLSCRSSGPRECESRGTRRASTEREPLTSGCPPHPRNAHRIRVVPPPVKPKLTTSARCTLRHAAPARTHKVTRRREVALAPTALVSSPLMPSPSRRLLLARPRRPRTPCPSPFPSPSPVPTSPRRLLRRPQVSRVTRPPSPALTP